MLYLFDFENGLFYSCSACETANRAYNTMKAFYLAQTDKRENQINTTYL